MKILVISHAYVEPDNHQKLTEMAKNKEVELAVVYPKKWKTWHGEEKVKREKLKVKRGYKGFALDTFFAGDGGKYFYQPLQLIIALIKFRPRLVYLEEEPFSYVAGQVAWLCRLLRIKLVFFTWENLDLPLGKKRSGIERFVFKTAVAAVTGNQGAKKRLVKRGFNKALEVVPQFGVDLDLFHPKKKSSSDAEEDFFFRPMVVGFVGRPVEAKGVDLLLRAAAKLDSRVNLLVVTSSAGIPEKLINLAIELKIREKISFEVNVAHAGLPEYFQKMDVFVLPSRATATWQEQFGRTLLEAMACGVPVIGSSSGAIPAVIGDAGLVFAEENVEDLSNKIQILIDLNQRQELSTKGLKYVQENFSNEKVAQRTLNFLSSAYQI